MRRAARVDETQAEIVAALRKAGVLVYCVGLPCDLLCRTPASQLFLLDCEGITEYRTRSKEQLEKFRQWGVIVVENPLEALSAVGAI